MKRLIVCFGLLVISLSNAEQQKSLEEFWAEKEEGKEYSMPSKYWEFMNGYRYEYSNPVCNVAWHMRSATFLASGDGCEQITSERMRKDAIISIEYVQQQGHYEDFSDYYYQLEENKKESSIVSYALKRDARLIWIEGCNDSKRRMYVDKSKHLNNEKEMIRSYPELKERLVMMLYRNGWRSAEHKRGAINCSNAAAFIVSDELILNYERW